MKLLSLGILCAVLSAGVMAQTCPLSIEATAIPVQQLTIADIDIENFRSSGLLFTVRIPSTDTGTVNAQLDVVLSIRLSDGREFPTAVTMRTDPFPVPPGGRIVTNLDVGDASDIGMETFEYDDAAQAAIEEGTLSSGLFPAGIYRLTFTLFNCPGADPVWVEFDLRNPSRITLISPMEGEVTGQFPVFEFYHEASSAQLTVTELLPGQSYEDAITRVPPMNQADLAAERTWLYTEGRPLETGKTYVWQLVTFVKASGGRDIGASSTLQSFTVGDGDGPYDALLARLQMMYGPQYPDLFKNIKDGRYAFTGNFSLDGSTLSEADLLRLLIDLQESTDDDELTLE